jgi:hypothetical protein
MLEKQQRSIDREPDSPQIDLVGDSGGLQARRIIERIVAEENNAARAAE